MSDNISPPTLHILCRELKEISEWEKLAVYLNLPDHVIQDAKECYPHGGIWERKMHCLKKWLDQPNTVHSWSTIADAVDKVNLSVAEHIRKKYATILDQVLTTSQNEKQFIVTEGPTSTHDPMINNLEQISSTSSNDDQHSTSNSKIEEEKPLIKEVVEKDVY